MAKKVMDRSNKARPADAGLPPERRSSGKNKKKASYRALEAAIGQFTATDADVRDGEIALDFRESREQGPAWTLVGRVTRFLEWLYLTAPGHPKLVAVQQAIQDFLQAFFFARYVLSAMEETPRRNVTGKDGALEQLGRVVSRSSAYNFLKDDLGIKDLDAFRKCKTMEAVIELSPKLREMLDSLEHLYKIMFRKHHPDMPPLFDRAMDEVSIESVLAGSGQR